MSVPFRSLPLLVALTQACAPHAAQVNHPRGEAESIEQLADRLDVLRDDDPRRIAWRAELAERIATRVGESTDPDELEAAVRSIARHLRPTEFEGELPPPLLALAERLFSVATRRGDAGVALGALCLLRVGRPDDTTLDEAERTVERWLDDARPDIREDDPSSLGLAYQYATEDPRLHATALCATPSALARAVRVLVEGSRPVLSIREARYRAVQQRIRMSLAATVVALHVVPGDLERARDALPRTVAPVESDVLEAALDDAGASGAAGADAILTLAESLGRLGREPLEGALRIGRRTHPDDPRFPLSLAHLARERGEPLAALVGYEEAVRLADGQPVAHEQALDELAQVAESMIDDEDPRAIVVARSVARVRRSYARRFPERVASLPSARFAWIAAGVALLEGEPDRAVASLRAESTVDLRIAVAEAELALDRAERALAAVDALLADARTLDADAEIHRGRALRVRGDALAELGRRAEADDAYRAAGLALRDARDAGPSASTEAARLALRTNDAERAVDALTTTIERAPGAVDAYVALVEVGVAGRAELSALDHAFAHATVHESLHPEVLASLAAIASLARDDVDRDAAPAVIRVLERSRSLRGFGGAVARYALGREGDAALLGAADTPGRRSEARLLIALRARRDGDRAAFERGLREVVALGMFREPSHGIARLLLRESTGQGVAEGTP